MSFYKCPEEPSLFVNNAQKPTEDKQHQEQDSDTEEESVSNKSNTWQLLEANSSGKFKITPPNYNAYQQEVKHWLEQPPIPWTRLNESTVKCENWLSRQQND